MPLHGLFLYGFDRGLGRPTNTEQLSLPWTIDALEAEFESLNRPVSAKSLENWRADRTQPSRRNIHVLSRIFSGGDPDAQAAWLDVLLTARRRTPVRSAPTGDTPVATVSDSRIVESAPAPEPDCALTADRPPRNSARYAILSALALAVTAICTIPIAVGDRSRPADMTISDVRFCTPDAFYIASSRCTSDTRAFAEDTRIIHVSFESANIPSGQPFARRWYREGALFLEKDGFFDDAWENWTWIGNPEGHDGGTYHLRIIIGERVFTESFTVAGPVPPPSDYAATFR